MPEDTLNLPVGATVQIQLNSADPMPRQSVRVVGYLPGGSLLVTTPTVNGRVQLVRPGQSYKVRMLKGDSVVGFSVRVLHVGVKPYPYLHLEWPRHLEQIIVRNSARVSTRKLCAVRNTKFSSEKQNFRKAEIIDLSETGARLSSNMPLGDYGDSLQLNFRLTVLGDVEEISLIAELRNILEREEENGDEAQLVYLSGVEFRGLNRAQQLIMHAWVMSKVAMGGVDHD